MSAMNGAPTASGQLLRERALAALEHFWCPRRVDDELRPTWKASGTSRSPPTPWPTCWPPRTADAASRSPSA
jgi:hypothetical protein